MRGIGAQGSPGFTELGHQPRFGSVSPVFSASTGWPRAPTAIEEHVRPFDSVRESVDAVVMSDQPG